MRSRLLLLAVLLSAIYATSFEIQASTSEQASTIQVPEAWELGNLEQAVAPNYPEAARDKGIGGKVVLRIHVDESGAVTSVEPQEGDPILENAAMDALKRWKFRIYIRDAKRVGVDTTVSFVFDTATGAVIAPKPNIEAPHLRVSQGVAKANLVHKVNPDYPQKARDERIAGVVLLGFTINREGFVENLHVIAGHPLLAQAALDAVKHWRYKPYLLNGKPVYVDTVAKINFQP